MNLARAKERLGHPGEAVFHYRETLRLRPDDPDAAKAVDRLDAQGYGPEGRSLSC